MRIPSLPNPPERLLAALILVCVATGTALMSVPEPRTLSVPSKSMYQAAIGEVARGMGIADPQIRRRDFEVDSAFTRTVWTIDVPPSFSKTTFHYRLDADLRALGLLTPASVDLPSRTMQIHILHRHTVLETVTLRTRDNDLAAPGLGASGIESAPVP